MPTGLKLSERLSSRKALTFIGALAGTALALLTLETELSFRLDALIVTEAEAADFAEQQRIDRLIDRIAIEGLKLIHAETDTQRDLIEAELKRLRSQLAYILCITEPGMNPDHCVRG